MLRVVLCNCSPDESRELAQRLVDAQLAACVNIVSDVWSCYRWEEEVCEEEEDTLLIKTSESRYEEMKEKLQTWHSYDVPEIVALEATDVLEAYLEWTRQQTRSDA